MNKEFRLTIIEKTKGTKEGYLFTSENRGFNTLELVGLLSMKLHDIQQQQAGKVKPKVKYDRTVIVKKKPKEKAK